MNWERFKEMIAEYPGGRQAIADALGMRYNTLSQQIQRKNMNLAVFERICDILEVPAHTFLSRKPGKK